MLKIQIPSNRENNNDTVDIMNNDDFHLIQSETSNKKEREEHKIQERNIEFN